MGNQPALDLTAEQKDALLELRRQREAKFTEIMALLARERGHGDLAALDPVLRQEMSDQATAAIDHWVEQAEMDRREPPAASTPSALQRLLNQHYELGEQGVDILDEAADPQ